MSNNSIIKIFFDTNILHTKQAHLLLPKSVEDYIRDHRRIESVNIRWCIPKMVIDERRHQMQKAAYALIPKLNEIESIIDHSLGITEEILNDRIDSKIERISNDLGFEIIDIDPSKIDIIDLANRSAKREPPFEIKGAAEKGFRDSMIAASFLKEVADSPITPRICRLVFVTADSRLKDYIKEKTDQCNNIRMMDSLDDLKSFINAIASEVTEEFLSKISPDASKVFYDFEKKDGLYNKEQLFERITQEYQGEINSVTKDFPNSIRVSDGVILGEQTFIDKTSQIVHWTKEVILKFKVEEPLNPWETSFTFTSANIFQPKEKESAKQFATGSSKFLIHWQHQVTTTNKITRPKINRIEFIEHEINKNPLF